MSDSWDSVIELSNYVEEKIHGEVIKTLEWTKVFANKKSVRQSEFYEARNLGLKPELMFEVHSFEFNYADKIRYQEKEYNIVRVYDKGEKTELTVTSFTGSDI